MYYRETGQFKTSYAADQSIFPIKQDRWVMYFQLTVAILVIPMFLSEYLANAIMIPFLCYVLAALGLNILVGYCGQISLGTGGFMAVGAYASFKLMTAFPDLNIFFVILLSGLITAGVGILFGLPSLRIKGFYLAAATLAPQFFFPWLFNKIGWFYNNSATGQITAPPRDIFGFGIMKGVPAAENAWLVTSAHASHYTKYFFCLSFVIVFALVAKNLVRGRTGREWMAIRDMDIAAELIGVRPLLAKLSAFGISSFYIGMAGALYFAVWLGAVEAQEAFTITESFNILFMVILGGLGSILGSFLGAAFIVVLPIILKLFLADMLGMVPTTAEHLNFIIVGGLIIFFLIMEPHGLARLYHIVKEKMRLWPFPY